MKNRRRRKKDGSVRERKGRRGAKYFSKQFCRD
jgi:hypothetical protein